MDYCKKTILKTNSLEDKENVSSSQSASKCTEGKSDVERKKGLSVGAENRRNDVDRAMPIQKFAIGSKAQFQVYRDDNERKERSRSLVRKGSCRKENRRVKDRVQESPIHIKAREKVEPTRSITFVPHR